MFQGATHVISPVTSDPIKYARMLAKIAHGVAVWWLGEAGFTHVLKPVIDERTENPWAMVGGGLEPSPSFYRLAIQLSLGYPKDATRERLKSAPFYPRASVHRSDKNPA